MALRVLSENPSIGGFGGEGNPFIEDGDAVAQILKELVDNSADACRQLQNGIHKIEVIVEENEKNNEFLNVTVRDNGIGMSSIKDCILQFSTTKTGNDEENVGAGTNTAGRYGMGLTLSLLHARRLAKGSDATIRSTTKDSSHWTTVTCYVDKESVHRTSENTEEKEEDDISGTSIVILLPVRSHFVHSEMIPTLG